MKKEEDELLEFLGGLAMLVVGLYFFMDKVSVSNSWFGGGFFGISWMSSGLVVIPFIIGIVLLFVNYESFFAKLVTGLGLLLIIASVVASTHLTLQRITLFDWLIMLVLIFGGLALVMKVLFHTPSSAKKDKKEKQRQL